MADSNQFVVIRLPATVTGDFHGRQVTVTHEVVFTLSWSGMCNSRWNVSIPVTVCPSFGEPSEERACAPTLSLSGVDPNVNRTIGAFPSIPVAQEVAAEHTAVSDAIPADWRASQVEIATAVALPSAPEDPLLLHRGSLKS